MAWTDFHVASLHSLMTMKTGDVLFNVCLDGGVSHSDLLEFINDPLKNRKSEPFDHKPAPYILNVLMAMGGSLAGGSVLNRILDRPPSKDVDIFFDSLNEYALAFFATRHCPSIDVGIYHSKPYESFDLCISMCSQSVNGVDLHPKCESALLNNISEIMLENVIAPEATLKRMIKFEKSTF